MKVSLKNILDLDYLIARDDALDSKDDIRSRELKDLRNYTKSQESSITDRHLLF